MIPNGSIDLVVTSPPYDNLRSYKDDIHKNWDFESFKSIAQQLVLKIKPGGVIVWIVNDATINGSETGTSFKQALYFKELGLNLHDTMIWYKGLAVHPMQTRYKQSFEYMFIFSLGKPRTANILHDRKNKYAGMSGRSSYREKDGHFSIKQRVTYADYSSRFNVWEIPPVQSKAERTGHPAQFPIALIQDHIKTWSDEGMTVLDLFMGSGTTAVACENLNRHWIGIELSEDYCVMTKERIKHNTASNQ